MTALVVVALAAAVIFTVTRPEAGLPTDEPLLGGASGVYGVQDLGHAVGGLDVRSRDTVVWLQDIQHGRRGHEVEIRDVRVAPVPFLDLEVTLSRAPNYFEWPAKPTRQMVVKGIEQVWIVVRASGPGCPFGPPGSAFVAKTAVTVDFTSKGRRGTATRELDPLLVAVPAGVAC